jgi:CubicO group peptidase (beta-lactamase class C family)
MLAAFPAAAQGALSSEISLSAQATAAPAPWVARHDLSPAQYQAAFTDYAKSGYRLTAVSGYVKGGGVRYAAVWRKVAGPPWVARHGLTAAAYQKAFDAYAKSGFRLVYVTGYAVKGVDHYAAIWEKRGGPAWIARHGLSASQYQALFDDLTKQKFRLVHVSGYTKGGSARYAAIFEKSTGPAGITHPAMTASEYQKRYTEYAKLGFRLKLVSGYRVGAVDQYAAIWEKVGGRVMRARHGTPLASYQRLFDVDRFQGYAPIYVQGFTSGSSVKFNTIWESPFRKQDLETIRDAFEGFLTKHKVAGLSVAIAKDGRLLYASGFGSADREKKVGLDVHHLLRIGSISKTITSVAMFQLVQAGTPQLLTRGIDTRVFGSGGVLAERCKTPVGDDCGVKVPASMRRLEEATIAHFLGHTSGLPGAGAAAPGATMPGRNLRDPVNCASGNLSKRIQHEFDQHAAASAATRLPPLLGAPGEFNDYSNFSHMIVERVIEVLSGMSYENYVRTRVFAPSGITQPRLFRIGPFLETSGEAKHYRRNGTYAEYAPTETCELKPPGPGAGGWAMSAKDLLRYYVSVDGRPAREILTQANYTQMLTASPANMRYAKSWVVGGSWWTCMTESMGLKQGHNGGLAGGFSNMYELGNGYSFAIIGNQNTGEGTCTAKTSSGGSIVCGGDKQPSCSDDSVGRLLRVLTSIDWPDHDLF